MASRLILLSIVSLLSTFAFAQTPQLVSDVNISPLSMNPASSAVLSGFAYYAATDSVNGTELWRTDGTTGGTTLVKDINPGVGSSNPSFVTTIGSTLFFSADDGINGAELWKSDGTAAGTVLVKDLNPGALHSGPSRFFELSPGVILFMATEVSVGSEIWVTDGTAAGTSLLKDTRAGSLNGVSLGFGGSVFSKVGGVAIFRADDGVNGIELWKTDGTTAGTSILKDINPSGSSNPEGLSEPLGGFMYFGANDGTNGAELWRTNGTFAGTTLFLDIRPGLSSSGPINLTKIGNKVYFAANDGINGREPWTTDGTMGNTDLLKDILVGISDSNPTGFLGVGSTVFFRSQEVNGDRELFKSDGTELGTVLVKNINPTDDSTPTTITALGSKLIFSANTDIEGTELWSSDGTLAGTVLLKDTTGDAFPGFDFNFTPVVLGSNVLFVGRDAEQVSDFYLTDGTPAGTVLAVSGRDNTATEDSFPADFVLGDGKRAFFVAGNNQVGEEFFFSDGTAAGTVLAQDLTPGKQGTLDKANLDATILNGNFIGSLYTETNGEEPWISDGTSAGTLLLKDIDPGNDSSGASNFITFGGFAYFSAMDDANGEELWRTDGTAAGTVLFEDIFPGGNDSSPGNLTLFTGPSGAGFVFAANDGSGSELWFSDGTNAGTARIKDINTTAPNAGSSPSQLTVVGNRVFFTADDGVNGRELWVSDGTGAGTTLVKDFNSGAGGGIFNNFGAYPSKNGIIVGVDDLGGTGREPWFSDGTLAGTVSLGDLNPGPTSSFMAYPTEFNGIVFFTAQDDVHGDELWRTDGTAAGTALVKDIYPGPRGSSPNTLVVFDNRLFFSASDPTVGGELFVTDGTEAGTTVFFETTPGNEDSQPYDLRTNGEFLYFAAFNPTVGVEPWILEQEKCPFDSNILIADCPFTAEFGNRITALMKLIKKFKLTTDPKVLKKQNKRKKEIKAALVDLKQFLTDFGPSINADPGVDLSKLLGASSKKTKRALKRLLSFDTDKRNALKAVAKLKKGLAI